MTEELEVRLQCIDCDSTHHKKLSDRKRRCRECETEFYVSPAETAHFRPWKWWGLTIAKLCVIALSFAIAGLYVVEGRGKYGLIFVALGLLFAVEEKEQVQEAIQNLR